MRQFLKLTAASLIAGLVFQGTAFAQAAGSQTFSPKSHEYASEAQAFQAKNEHKSAVKRLKKGLKLKGLTPYEASAMYQMQGASFYALKKYDDAIESFEGAISAGGLSRTDKQNLQENIAQLNMAEENYALAAQQLETFFREGGPQKSKLVKMIVRAHLQAKNRDAAVPWAEVMLRQGLIDTRKEHDVSIYLFDSPEKRSNQMQVARRLYAKWPNDPAVLTQIARLNAKAQRDGVATVVVAGQ